MKWNIGKMELFRFPFLCDLLPGKNFSGADLVFEGVLLIFFFDAKPCVCIARPASAEV
jgi:hypothetical protein